MKNIITAILIGLATIASSPSHAWKGMGGGGGNTGDGSAFDIEEGKHLSKMDVDALYALTKTAIPERFRQFPQLEYLIVRPLAQKFWNLSAKPLNPKCETPAISGNSPEIVGCQTHTEVRILASWWNKADDSEKAALIIHEALLAFYENTPYDVESVRPLVRVLMSDATREQVREVFGKSGFGALAFNEDITKLRRVYDETRVQLCTQGKLTNGSDWIMEEDPMFTQTAITMRERLTARFYDAQSCAKVVLVDDKELLYWWILTNWLHLSWLDDGSIIVEDQVSFRIWLLLQAI